MTKKSTNVLRGRQQPCLLKIEALLGYADKMWFYLHPQEWFLAKVTMRKQVCTLAFSDLDILAYPTDGTPTTSRACQYQNCAS